MLKALYRFLQAASVPGTARAGVELHLLTSGGARMLFFSVAHTMGLRLLVLFLSAVTLIALVLLALVAILSISANVGFRSGRTISLPTAMGRQRQFAALASGHSSSVGIQSGADFG